jgi:hypothetical protein
MENPIEVAVAPLKNDAIERAEKEAKDIVEKVRSSLEAVGNDLELAAPYPKSWGADRNTYIMQLSKYKLFCSLVKHRARSRSRNEPDFVDIDTTLVEKFVERTKQDAAFQYDAFVAKLQRKIGEVKDATLTGNHVWGHSILTVTLPDDSKQRWKTHMIVNRSKLGTLFNQWPSRKVK